MVQQEFVVPPNGELRVHTPAAPVFVSLSESGAGFSAKADAMGFPLEVDVPVEVEEGKRMAFTSPTGATFTVKAASSEDMRGVYISTTGQHAAKNLIEVHQYLENIRQKLPLGKNAQGPRVLVCGTDAGSGKSTIARTLANYAVLQGYHPLFWDLDVNSPRNCGFPCSLNLAALQHPIDLDDGAMAPGQHVHFGFNRGPDQNQEFNHAFFMHCVSKLWQISARRLLRHDRCGISGMFIDYPTIDANAVRSDDTDTRSKDAGALACLLHTINECEIDTVIVVGNDWLRHQLRYACSKNVVVDPKQTDENKWKILVTTSATGMRSEVGAHVRVICMEAHDGAAPLGVAERDAVHTARWKKYFFGVPSTPLAPTIIEVPVQRVKVVEIGTIASSNLQQMLPMGDDSANDAANIAYVGPEYHDDDVDPLVPLPEELFVQKRVAAVSNVSFLQLGEVVDESLGTRANPTKMDQVEFESELRSCGTIGYVVLVGKTATHMQLATSMGELPLGTALLLTESSLDAF